MQKVNNLYYTCHSRKPEYRTKLELYVFPLQNRKYVDVIMMKNKLQNNNS